MIRRWFSTDNSGSSSRRDLDDVDDDDGVRSGLNESRLDEECVNALVGAEGAAQALGLVPPPPHVGPVESAAYERDRAERAGYIATVLAAARDAIVFVPDDEFGPTPMQGTFPKLSRTPSAIRKSAPSTVGEDTQSVRKRWLGE